MTTMNAQEKSQRGLPLSAADIQELLKDPNSWVSKLYADCMMYSAMAEHAFILFLELTMKEEALALSQEKASALEQQYREERMALQPSTVPNIFDVTPAQIPEFQSLLQIELKSLLAIPQSSMTAAQLNQHHQNLTANFNNQVSAQLGPVVTLASGTQLNIPQLVSPPAISASQVLQPNPGLAVTVNSNPGMQNAFATFHTQAETGHFAVLKKYREILNANNIDDLQPVDKKEMFRLIDSVVRHIKDNNQSLAEQLFYNNSLSLKLFSNNSLNVNPIIQEPMPSLSKPPAMFAVTPYQLIKDGPQFGKRRLLADEENGNTIRVKTR